MVTEMQVDHIEDAGQKRKCGSLYDSLFRIPKVEVVPNTIELEAEDSNEELFDAMIKISLFADDCGQVLNMKIKEKCIK